MSHPSKTSSRGEILWSPSQERKQQSHLHAFLNQLNESQQLKFDSYEALHQWSVTEPQLFWPEVAQYCGLKLIGDPSVVLSEFVMPGARWFPDAQLSFTQHLLDPSSKVEAETPAIIFEGEQKEFSRTLSFSELYQQVALAAAGLKKLGVQEGDRVAAWTPNVPEAVIAMLATASLGAIWSSCSPDFGPQGVLDRFGQIEPKVLFAADGYSYNGKIHGSESRLQNIIDSIPSIEEVIIYPYTGPKIETLPQNWHTWETFTTIDPLEKEELFKPYPFNQPLFILYTSGTTGKPKCLVHSAGGTLLKHFQEHQLQVDVQSKDRLFYFTTCGWMMWNWLVTGLASGATIVLYDGAPTYPKLDRLFELADQHKISIFGTSPRFLSVIEKNHLNPKKDHDLSSLKTMLSTGAPLHAPQFRFVYESIHEDIQLSSISGGTDLIGCFVAGSPFHDVRAGEIPCRVLGMDVLSFNENGEPQVNSKGELVCKSPFPSVPLCFFGDSDGSKFQAAYFEKYPGYWHHGDFIEITDEGSVVIYGRSDATLNPSGVRIGTAEIYRVVEEFDIIEDALAVGIVEQSKKDSSTSQDGDVIILLYVVLKDSQVLNEEFVTSVKAKIREALTPRHVPHEIHQITEVPRTISGKPVEIAVAKILQGQEPGNREALANPESLDQFKAR